MTVCYIGRPGERPRILTSENDPARLVRDEEVCLPADAICDYVISDDGRALVEVPVNPEVAIRAMRAERDRLLAGCDWTQLPDSPLTDAKRAEWTTYRRQLRDMPFAESPPWPAPPE